MRRRGLGEPAPEYQDKSRSRKKRESTALQERGEFLAALPQAVQKTLPLDADLAAALAEWRGLRTREAKRRHLQYIGRLMRELDTEAQNTLLGALDDLQSEGRRAAEGLHGLERTRDALLGTDEDGRETALRETLRACPALDEARLRHLIAAALADREKKRPPRHARELFRYLREATPGEAAPENG